MQTNQHPADPNPTGAGYTVVFVSSFLFPPSKSISCIVLVELQLWKTHGAFVHFFIHKVSRQISLANVSAREHVWWACKAAYVSWRILFQCNFTTTSSSNKAKIGAKVVSLKNASLLFGKSFYGWLKSFIYIEIRR